MARAKKHKTNLVRPEFDDFRVFLVYLWGELGLPSPTPVQLQIAHWLQHGPKRKVIEAFRGVGKSWITAAYVVWKLMHNPDLKFLVVSASKDRSDNFSIFTKQLLLEIEPLNFLAPNKRDGDRSSNISFDVAPASPDQSPSVKSVGIYGQLTGTRADEIIADDIEVPGNSLTHGARARLSEAVKEFDSIIKPGGRITYLGTPQCEQSLYNELPERGYVIRAWPARYPKLPELLIYGETLAPTIRHKLEAHNELEDAPTDPRRFNEEDLIERALSYGKAGFAMQFMLNTSLSDLEKYPLKLRDLIVFDGDFTQGEAPEKVIWASSPDLRNEEIPCVGMKGDYYYRPMSVARDWIPFTGSVMVIDPSGRGKDETSYAVVKMLNGFLYLVDAGGYRGGYEEVTLRKLAESAKKNTVNLIIIEANFGDGMFTQILKPVLQQVYPHCSVEEIKNNKQKELRIIDTLEPVMSNHRLIVSAEVIKKDFESTQGYPTESAHHYQMFWQMTRLTRERGSLPHDDRLDALAMAVAYWVEYMAQDADTQIRRRVDKLMEKELEVFMTGTTKPLNKQYLSSGLFSTMGMTPGIGNVIDIRSGKAIDNTLADTWINLHR